MIRRIVTGPQGALDEHHGSEHHGRRHSDKQKNVTRHRPTPVFARAGYLPGEQERRQRSVLAFAHVSARVSVDDDPSSGAISWR